MLWKHRENSTKGWKSKKFDVNTIMQLYNKKIYTLINIKNWILTFGTEPISKSLIKNLFHIKKYDAKNPKGVTELVKNLMSCIFNIKLLVLSQ